MSILDLLAIGFSNAATINGLLAIGAGVFVGQMVGVLPGVGPAAGMALLLPVTFGMDPINAIMMLTGILYGGMYGGTLTSVLLNVPGEASSIMTAVDGHALAKQGRAGAALSIAAIGSFIAGIAGTVVLVLAASFLTAVALRFNAPEFFLITLLGLTATASLGSGSTIKALVVAGFGLIVAMVGTDPLTGYPRLNFGSDQLLDGFEFLPIAIGIFGIAEVLVSMERLGDDRPMKTSLRDMTITWKDWTESWRPILRGTGIGFIAGMMPGPGATISSMLAYVVEKRFSKHPELFGKGALDAIASSESANNSSVSGGLAPMLALGIPGGASTAIIMAALILHGIRPGPMLMAEQSTLVWSLFASMFIGNILLLIMNLPLAPVFAMLLRIPYAYLAPGIIAISLTGAYATTLSFYTVFTALGFGVIGYFMIKADFPRAPLLLAVVLAPMMESSLRQSLLLSLGDPMIFIYRPISAVLLALVVLALLGPFLFPLLKRAKRKAAQKALPQEQ